MGALRKLPMRARGSRAGSAPERRPGKSPGRPPEKPPKATSAPSSPEADEDASVPDATATVTYMVDGDTVDVSPVVDSIQRVRLIGVDTPETRECPGRQPLS